MKHKLLFTNNAIHRKKLPPQTDYNNYNKNHSLQKSQIFKVNSQAQVIIFNCMNKTITVYKQSQCRLQNE